MLSQDTSRHFLHSSQPGAKFKLFMKGTHLEQMSNDYALAKEQQELMKHEIARKKEMLPLLQKNAKQFEEILQGNLLCACGIDVLELLSLLKCTTPRYSCATLVQWSRQS